jgi:transcriptional regulator of acetoin/glycerol metabolism
MLDDARLAEIRSSHPLASVMPVIRRLLVDSAAEAGLLVAVSDAAGRLLWVEGSPDLRSRAEAMNFLPGADWSEGVAGTNAPGTALALDLPVQFLGPEHLSPDW